MLIVKARDRVPPGGYFRYVCPESGIVIEHPYYHECLVRATNHRKINNFPIGLEWEQQFEQNVCENAKEGVCKDEPSPGALALMSQFARAAYQWARNGLRIVSEETLNERRKICFACDAWQGEKYFGVGGCRACGCSATKLYLPTEKCPRDKWPKAT